MQITPIPLQSPSQVVDRGAKSAETGLFSAFTSYISSYAADDPPEPSDEELESTLCTVDCVNSCRIGDVFANIVNLPVETLEPLVQALMSQLPDEPIADDASEKDEAVSQSNGQKERTTQGPVYSPAYVYVLELSTVLALRDTETVNVLGSSIADALQAVLRDNTFYHQTMVGRVVFYLFCLLKKSYDSTFIRVPVVLHHIATFNKNLLEKSSMHILNGMLECLQLPGPLHNEIITSPDFWVILRTFTKTDEETAIVFKILEGVNNGQTPPSVMADNYEPVVTLLNEFASAASIGSVKEQTIDRRKRVQPQAKPVKAEPDAVVQRGVKAVGMIYELTTRIPTLIQQSHLDPINGKPYAITLKNATNDFSAWKAYWSPVFAALTNQCTNPCREIRHAAFSSLQRALLSASLNTGVSQSWTAIFDEVLFPLIFRLLKPEVYSTDPAGMSETRLQAANLLCRVFLHYLPQLAEWDGMLGLWENILDVMDRLMNSGQGDSLEEAVRESLKNILLVMSTGGYLVRGSGDENLEKLWEETWKRLERFLPDLKGELRLAREDEVPAEAPAPAAEGGDEKTEKRADESAPAIDGPQPEAGVVPTV